MQLIQFHNTLTHAYNQIYPISPLNASSIFINLIF